ncbi:hypothetical protein [Eubacterium limosum]|uniref:hypothetical protein n=1 Tax=Eubacterium limosum TaxID=1736 RepID=UPI003724BF0A
MKKKASLLISGITTVAMLAVAVGSFAAWNTLSATVDQVSATSATPTILTVTNDAANFANKKLVPSDVTPTADSDEVQALTTQFTPTLSQEGSNKKIILKTADLKYNDTDNDGTLKMTIYKASDENTTVVKDGDLESGVAYIAKVEFVNKDNAWTPETAKAAEKKNITLDIVCEAVDVTKVS